MKKITTLIIGILTSILFLPHAANSQCAANITANPQTATCGNKTIDFVVGYSIATTFDFNSGSLPAGWTSSPYLVSSPCQTNTPDNSPYFWATTLGAGNTRFVVTNPVNVTSGGNIVFDMRYGSDDPSLGCEDPDRSIEGVFLQYSNNGGAWVTIQSWTPVSGKIGPLYSWNIYTIAIPPGAIGPNTRFRWYQPRNSGQNFDNWGLDDITIQAGIGGIASYAWNFGDGNTSSSAAPTHTYANYGTYNVALTLSFNNGCSASTAQIVNIQADATPPNAVCQDFSIALDASGHASITAAQVDNGSTDNCSIASMSVSPNTFGCNDVGANTVTLTVLDDAGNPGVCTATVTVLDNLPPLALCKDFTVFLDASGSATISGADIDNGSNAPCGVTLSVSPSTFSCADIGVNAVTLTATDVSGNTSTCVANVTVKHLSSLHPFATVDYVANGNAVYQGSNTYQLTNYYGQWGTVWFQNQLTLSKDFDIEVDVYLGNNNGGADGMAFVLQPLSSGQGSSGGGLGYRGLSPSLAVEFDTWHNATDPLDDHIALQANGETYHNTPNTLAGPVALPNLENGQYHAVRVQWNSTLNNLKVYLDNVLRINYTGDITNTIFGGNAGVYWGFTGATGSAYNVQKVRINTVSFYEQMTISSANILDASCVTSSDGAIDITVIPDHPCYTYSWSNGATTEDVSGLPVGNYSLTITDVDGSTVTQSFTIGNGDVTPPVMSTQDINVYLDALGNATITPSDVDNGSTDNCAITSLTLDNMNFSCALVGPNTVNLTATDAAGNQNSMPATVTVIDTLSPVAMCKPATVTLSGGVANVTALMVDNGSNDACGIASMSVSPNAFDCSNIGDNPVTLTVTDNNGNVSTCSAMVTVVGVVPSCNISLTLSNSTYTGGNGQTIFLGYGPQSLTASVSASGAGPFTYSWTGGNGFLDSTTTANPIFTPTTAGNYTLVCTVTNSYGCETTCQIDICVMDIRVPGKKNKVYICHSPPGNSANAHTLAVSVNAVPAHLSNHAGDRLGSCDQSCSNLFPKLGFEEAHASDLTIYPNPSNEDFNLVLHSHTDGNMSIKVYDAMGRTLIHLDDVNPNEEISFGSELPTGYYNVRVMQGDFIETMKIVKINR